jgi:hypothetical protein
VRAGQEFKLRYVRLAKLGFVSTSRVGWDRNLRRHPIGNWLGCYGGQVPA